MTEGSYYSLGRFLSKFFRGANCVPIRRGDRRGLQNPQLGVLHGRLNGICPVGERKKKNVKVKREWCHLMAEGRILQPWRYDPQGLPRLGKLRLGTAKLVASSPPKKTVVLPVFHDGMHNLTPETPPPTKGGRSNIVVDNRSGKTEKWVPTSGNRVDVYIGEPIDFSDLVPADGLPFSESPNMRLLNAINDRLRDALLVLEKRAADGRKSR